MLTNRVSIDRCIDDGELTEWRPSKTQFGIHRVVLLRRQPFDWLSEPKGEASDDLEKLRQQTIAEINAFIWRTADIGLHLKEIGGRIGVCEWKQQAPKPGMRILGTLVRHDVFVGMMAFTRDQLPFAHRPNQADPQLWPFLMGVCQSEHNRLFPEHPALRLSAAITQDDLDDI